MAPLFPILRWLHIAAGFSALVLFCIPAVARKGGKAHIRAGWFYVVCMSVVDDCRGGKDGQPRIVVAKIF